MLRGPPLLLKRSDLAPLWHFSEAFEHLEETESLFEENSETNLLIKSGSEFSQPVCSSSKRRADGRTGEGPLPLLTHPQSKGRHFRGAHGGV